MATARQKSLFISSFKKLPAVLIISVILFFIVQAVVLKTDFVWRFFYINSRPAIDHFLRKEAELRLIDKKSDELRIFLVGSSIAHEGYDEDYLNKEFSGKGVKFYNFGSGGITPIELFSLRNKYIKKKPDLIVFPGNIGDFYKDYNYGSLKYFFTFELVPFFADYIGYGDMLDHKGEFIDSTIGRFISLYRYNKSIIRAVEAAIRDRTLGIEKESPEKIKKIGQRAPEFFEKIESTDKKFKETKYTFLYKKMFSEFANDINAAGIKFIFIDMPLHSRATAISESELQEDFSKFLYQESINNKFEYIENDSLPTFTDNEFSDFSHLNELGRIKNSDFLIRYILNQLKN